MTESREQRRLLASADAKLYAVAVIAVVYLIAWHEVSMPQPVVRAPAARRAVWIDQVASTERPKLVPPAGWRVASRAERAAPPVVSAPASRPIRMRTRSS